MNITWPTDPKTTRNHDYGKYLRFNLILSFYRRHHHIFHVCRVIWWEIHGKNQIFLYFQWEFVGRILRQTRIEINHQSAGIVSQSAYAKIGGKKRGLGVSTESALFPPIFAYAHWLTIPALWLVAFDPSLMQNPTDEFSLKMQENLIFTIKLLYRHGKCGDVVGRMTKLS